MSLLAAGRVDWIKGPLQPELFCDSVHHRKRGVPLVLVKVVVPVPFASIKQRHPRALFFLTASQTANGFLWSGATSESFKGSKCWLGTLQLKGHTFQMRSELTRKEEKTLRKGMS